MIVLDHQLQLVIRRHIDRLKEIGVGPPARIVAMPDHPAVGPRVGPRKLEVPVVLVVEDQQGVVITAPAGRLDIDRRLQI